MTSPASPQYMRPRTAISWRLVESLTESLTQTQFSEQRSLEDVVYDDTALEETLRNAHRVHVYHSQREGLSDGQSSSSVSEGTMRSVVGRTGRSVVEKGKELNTEHVQIRTLLDRQRKHILADCKVEIKRHEVQENYDRRKQKSETFESQQEELIALKQKNFKDETNNFFMHSFLVRNWEFREARDKSQ